MVVVWPQVWPACKTKYAKRFIVRLFLKKTLNPGFKIDDFARKQIN